MDVDEFVSELRDRFEDDDQIEFRIGTKTYKIAEDGIKWDADAEKAVIQLEASNK